MCIRDSSQLEVAPQIDQGNVGTRNIAKMGGKMLGVKVKQVNNFYQCSWHELWHHPVGTQFSHVYPTSLEFWMREVA